MSFKATALAALLAAAICSAQTTTPATADKTFDFTNKPSAQGLQEIATVLRTVADLQHLSLNSDNATVTVNGNTDQLAMAAWLIHELDQPAQVVPSPTDQYPVTGGAELTPNAGDDVIRVFFLQHTDTPQGMQEMMTILRTVANIQKVFSYSAPHGLVVRGRANEIAFAQYLINAIDVVPGSVTSSAEFHYDSPRLPSSVARVFYLANVSTPQQTQEILTVLRTVADIQKVFNATGVKALAICASASDLAVSEWIIKSLDIPLSAKPGPNAAAHEFTMPANAAVGNIVRVFYPANIKTAQQMQQTLTLLRTKVPVTKVFNYMSLPAIVLRGTSDQVTKSEQLIQEQDRPAIAAAITRGE